MDETCSMKKTDKCLIYWGENTWDPDAAVRITLKWILRNQIVNMWTGFVRFRTGSRKALFWTWQWKFGFHKMYRISWLHEGLLISQAVCYLITKLLCAFLNYRNKNERHNSQFRYTADVMYSRESKRVFPCISLEHPLPLKTSEPTKLLDLYGLCILECIQRTCNARVRSNAIKSTWFQLHVKYDLCLKNKRNKITFFQQVLVQTPCKPHFICSVAAASETK